MKFNAFLTLLRDKNVVPLVLILSLGLKVYLTNNYCIVTIVQINFSLHIYSRVNHMVK